jgi:hypothetical protein
MGMKIVVSDEFGATVAEYSTAGMSLHNGTRDSQAVACSCHSVKVRSLGLNIQVQQP